MDVTKAIYLPIGIFAVLIIALGMQGVIGSNWTVVAQNVTPVILMMAVLGFIFGLVYGGGGSFKTVISIVVFGVAGIIFNLIFENLYDRGILFDEFITGTITVPDVMSVMLIFWTLIGIVVGVIRE